MPTLAPSIEIDQATDTPTSETSSENGYITIFTSNTNTAPSQSPTTTTTSQLSSSLPPSPAEVAVEPKTSTATRAAPFTLANAIILLGKLATL